MLASLVEHFIYACFTDFLFFTNQQLKCGENKDSQ